MVDVLTDVVASVTADVAAPDVVVTSSRQRRLYVPIPFGLKPWGQAAIQVPSSR